MTRMYVALFLGLVSMLSACAQQPGTKDPASVRTIQITEVVAPTVLYAAPGEEVRWTNLRSNPVRLGFLSMRLLDDVGCDHGFRTLLGAMSDLITIPPGESVSICFVRRGDLKYNVWLEPDNPRGPITPTATIRVDHGG